MDCLGAAECPKDYVVGGTAANEMHGLAEALWHENMVRLVYDFKSQIQGAGYNTETKCGYNTKFSKKFVREWVL